jgi:hypothetical protein
MKLIIEGSKIAITTDSTDLFVKNAYLDLLIKGNINVNYVITNYKEFTKENIIKTITNWYSAKVFENTEKIAEEALNEFIEIYLDKLKVK